MTLPALERIAITGLGMVTSLGSDASESFRRLLAGEPGIATLGQELGLPLNSALVAEVGEQSADHWSTGTATDAFSRSERLALRAAREALAQAGIVDTEVELVIGGTTGAARESILAYSRVEAEHVEVLARSFAVDSLGEMSVNLRAVLPRLKSATVVCSACSSGALSIALGAMRLEQGEQLPQLVGGTDALSALTLLGFGCLGAMSKEPCRPFDARRMGLTLGEGAAMLVLESESMVRARNATVLAWLDGYAVGAEAHHLTHPEPDGKRATQLLRDAMQRAGFAPADVGYINAHGTATVPNDAMESKAFALALDQRVDGVPVSSSKGQLGHTLGAAGAIEAAIVVQSLAAQAVVPTVGLEQIAEDCPLCHVPGKGRAHEFSAALSTSFGFGGAGAVLALSHAGRPNHRPSAGVTGKPARLFVTGTVTLTAAGVRRGADNAAIGSERPRAAVHGELGFEPLERLVMERSRRFDRLSALTTLGVVEILADTGLPTESVGLVVGNSIGNVGRTVEFLSRVRARGARGAQPAEFPQMLTSTVSGNASIYAGLQGPVFNVADPGPSAESALRLAATCLRSGSVRAMIAGTAEMADAAVLAARNAMTPEAAVRVRSEDGAAFLLLEGVSRAFSGEGAVCELVWAGKLGDFDPSTLSLSGNERGEVHWADVDEPSVNEALCEWACAGFTKRELPTTVGRGWYLSACCLAVAASRVLSGDVEVAVVLTAPMGGRYVTVFRRVLA